MSVSEEQAPPKSPKAKPAMPERPNLGIVAFKCIALPLAVLIFFMVAPSWLNTKLHNEVREDIAKNSRYTPEERTQRESFFEQVDFRRVCLETPPGMESLHESLVHSGVCGNFQRLRLGFFASVVLVGIIAISLFSLMTLNDRARNSREDLIRSYRLSWRIAIAAALAKVILLMPLLAYGSFELTVLASDHYYPKLLILIILGGCIAIYRTVQILVHKLPLEFKERISREVTEQEAPELWAAVKRAAERLNTAPPDHIVIGMQFNFYVTELAVIHDTGKVSGRTLYLSYPLLKQFSEEEVVGIIGHELGHFIGEDTKMSREFYPFRFKVHTTMFAMGQSGFVAWPSFQLLNFFAWCFGETEQAASRAREFLADKKGAELTSAKIMTQSLVRLHVLTEAFDRGLMAVVQSNDPANPLEMRLHAVVREKLIPDGEFWEHLFERKMPHPLDSHPSLRDRLESLGESPDIQQAQTISVMEVETAYSRWFPNAENLFTKLTEQTDAVINKMRARKQVEEADFKTEAGKQLLNQHFPELRWKAKASAMWGPLVISVFLALMFLVFVFIFDGVGFRATFVTGSAICILCAVGSWKRHRHTEFILNAESIRYTGWERSLRFEDVEKLTGQNQNSTITLFFHLKAKQPPIWKFSLLKINREVISFPFNVLEGQQIANAQTVLRYFYRQIPDVEADEEDSD